MTNLNKVVEYSETYYDESYQSNIMGIYGTASNKRNVKLTSSDKEITDFSRCSYLGLDNDPRILEGAINEIKKHNALHWSCARTRLNFYGAMELEEILNEIFQAKTVTFPTVTQANQAILPLIGTDLLFSEKIDAFVIDKYAHTSLAYHKPVLSEYKPVITIEHNDINQLAELCHNQKICFICDGVYSMGGESPIGELIELQSNYGLKLYIDDAHGISIFGKNGQGYARSNFDKTLNKDTLIVTSLGKGFGASGGVIILPEKKQEKFIRRYAGPYAFSVGLNTAAIGASKASARIHLSDEIYNLQNNLCEKVNYFDKKVTTKQKGNLIPIRKIDTCCPKNAILTAKTLLNDQDIYCTAVFFPTVSKSSPGIRIAITSNHSYSNIDKLAKNILKIIDSVKSNGCKCE